METNQYLSRRFEEVMLNGTWIANTNFYDQLKTLDWQIAVQKPPAAFNSIAAITQHINYYISGVNQVLRGGDLTIRDKYSFDFPPITSEVQWKNILDASWSNSQEFAEHVRTMDDAQFEKPFVKEAYGSYLRNIEGMIEHCYYHLGQIVLIKKLILNT